MATRNVIKNSSGASSKDAILPATVRGAIAMDIFGLLVVLTTSSMSRDTVSAPRKSVTPLPSKRDITARVKALPSRAPRGTSHSMLERTNYLACSTTVCKILHFVQDDGAL